MVRRHPGRSPRWLEDTSEACSQSRWALEPKWGVLRVKDQKGPLAGVQAWGGDLGLDTMHLGTKNIGGVPHVADTEFSVTG